MRDRVTVAVGVVLVNKEKKILIAKRAADKPMPNKWEFPGGKLEIDESLQECAIREIKEELELDIAIDSYVGFEDLSYEKKEFCLHLYTAHIKDEGQKVKLNVHSQVQWVDFEEFKEYDFPAKELGFIKILKELLKV